MPAPFQITPPPSVVPQPLLFADWQGEGPPLVHEQGLVFTKPGADGVGLQKVGRHHPAIEVVLESHWQDFPTAVNALQIYRQVALSGEVGIIWAHINWSNFNMVAHVLSMDFVTAQQVVYLLHADYNYPFGAKLFTRWRFQPVEVG